MNKLRFFVSLACACIGLFCGHTLPVIAQTPKAKARNVAVLTVKHMCCAKESVPAIKELSKVPGVKRVSVDYKARALTIEPASNAPSPKALWEAAERIKIEPIRLATPQGVYTSCPRR